MWSLRRALVLAFLVVVTVPLTLFWLWPQTRAMQSEVQQVQEKHLLLARNIGATLDRYARDLLATFDYLAENLLAGRPVEAPGSLLTSLGIRQVYLVDIGAGRILRQIAGLREAVLETLPAEQVQQLLALAAVRGSLPGPVAKSADGRTALPIVRVAGDKLVLAVIDTEYFRELARSISFGKRGHAIITDHTGQVLAHPQPAWERDIRNLSGVSIVQRIFRGETGVDTFFAPAFMEDMIAGFAVVRQTGWGVIVPQPLSELTAAATRINMSAFWIFSLGMILAALIGLRFSLLVIKPLSGVIEGAARMANNEKDVQISLPGRLVPREFTALAATFNEMARNISFARDQEANARARAETANTQKTEFVRYITHELRSPVAAILGFARVLSAEAGRHTAGDPGKSAGQIKHIHDAATHLLSLVNDLLDLGKIEAGQYSLNEVPLGVDEIAYRCFAMLGEAARVRDIKLLANMGVAAPEIMADERAMYQVLLNLVTNSVRYGHTGGSVEVRAGVRGDGSIEIIVADDGPGIAPHDIERVMHPFERIERAATASAPGTGLGLPIVKRLVELHGGRFRLVSALGAGTVAYIELPAARNLAAAGKLATAA